MPSLAEPMILGAVAQARSRGEADISLEELGLELAGRALRVEPRAATAVERRRAVRAATAR